MDQQQDHNGEEQKLTDEQKQNADIAKMVASNLMRSYLRSDIYMEAVRRPKRKTVTFEQLDLIVTSIVYAIKEKPGMIEDAFVKIKELIDKKEKETKE